MAVILIDEKYVFDLSNMGARMDMDKREVIIYPIHGSEQNDVWKFSDNADCKDGFIVAKECFTRIITFFKSTYPDFTL